MEYIAGLLNIFYAWGPSAISSALLVVVIYLVKKIDKNSEADKTRSQELRDYINKALNGLGERLSVVEKEYVRNDFFYREFSGWRSEINNISEKIDRNYKDLIQNIIQLLKKGAE